jgi:3-methyladenine DNA glycosylase/8-oxoguanine DNA glycosylase
MLRRTLADDLGGSMGMFGQNGDLQRKAKLYDFAPRRRAEARCCEVRGRGSSYRAIVVQTGEKIRLPRGALVRLRAADPALGSVIDRIGRFAMLRGQADNDLEALARAIVYQQLSGKAAATIYGRFRALFDARRFPMPEEILTVHHTRLRKAGLSRQKQAALRDLCRHVADGRLPLGNAAAPLADEELIDRLIAVRGIGRWSAQMFLMFHLGRLDVWPEDDLGVRKAVAHLHALIAVPSRREMLAHGEAYRPYRTIASWYLWRSLDTDGQI